VGASVSSSAVVPIPRPVRTNATPQRESDQSSDDAHRLTQSAAELTAVSPCASSSSGLLWVRFDAMGQLRFLAARGVRG
jgi:hypothetical protein